MGGDQGPITMAIGNVEQQGRRLKLEDQRLKLYQNNAWFNCHKVGWSPWKHQGNADSKNLKVKDGVQEEVIEEQNYD